MAAGAHAFVHKKVNYGIKYFFKFIFHFFFMTTLFHGTCIRRSTCTKRSPRHSGDRLMQVWLLKNTNVLERTRVLPFIFSIIVIIIIIIIIIVVIYAVKTSWCLKYNKIGRNYVTYLLDRSSNIKGQKIMNI